MLRSKKKQKWIKKHEEDKSRISELESQHAAEKECSQKLREQLLLAQKERGRDEPAAVAPVAERKRVAAFNSIEEPLAEVETWTEESYYHKSVSQVRLIAKMS